MSKLNQIPNLRVEDFPSERQWIGRLFTMLNPLILQISQILDRNIDFATNIKAVTRELESSSLTVPIQFEWPYPSFTPAELSIVKATANGVPTVLLAAWEYNASTGLIRITNLLEVGDAAVSAVTSGTRYKLTVRVNV